MSKEKKIEIGIIIKEAREEMGLSQRELAKKAQIDNAEISRIESGKRQKPNIIVLKNIAEILDLSLVKLMKLSGYNETDINFGRDLDDKRSLRDYKNIINDYQRFYYDVLEDISKRRNNDFKANNIIEMLIEKISYQTKKISEDEILEELKKASEILKNNLPKLDSSKYPNSDPIIAFYQNKDIEKQLRKNSNPVNFDNIIEKE